MRFSESIKNFLYDKNYYISIYDDKIHLFGYKDITKLTNIEVGVTFDNFLLFIKGNNLTIIKMDKDEIMIQGLITSVSKNEK